MADDANSGSIPGPSPKAWNVSASLRAFYDDNYSTAPNKKGSFGIEFSPSVSANFDLKQTDFGARYTYGLYWYEERQNLGQNPLDQSHQVDLWLDHAFDERWKANVANTFAIGQEPELLGTSASQPFRVEGNNIANHFNTKLDTQWTRLFSTEIAYGNDFYDYQDNNAGQLYSTQGGDPSLAGLLNRDENSGEVDLQWHVQPETMIFTGYSVDWTDYNANEAIGLIPGAGGGSPSDYYHSKDRDLLENKVYVGVQHQITPNLGGMVRVGADYADNYNDNTPGQAQDSWSPYVDLSLTYTYLPGSYAQFGFTHDINATDVGTTTVNGAGSALTQYEESSIIYASVNHRFTEKLTGTLIGQIIYSDFQGGASNAGADVDYTFGATLAYQINQFLSVDTGYNYDNLQSGIAGRGYNRNRVYLGLTASY
jgi:hypothetical protein